MAVIGTTALTLADWAARQGPQGQGLATVVELLSVTNEILDDMLFVEGNLSTGHKSVVRTGLPSATWRLLNYGVPNGKSTTAPIIDTCGNLETYAVVDKDLADLNGNTAEFRMSESSAFLEGMSQQVATTVIYGNTAVNPERFMGLAPRYNSVNPATAQTAVNVIDAGGVGTDNTSLWIVTWAPNKSFGFFPKGKATGLRHTNMGEWPVQDANNNTYQAYRDHFKWEIGLAVSDWRYNARIANIDVSDLSTVNAANMINGVIRAMYRIPTLNASATPFQSQGGSGVPGGNRVAYSGRTVIYCNRTVRTFLDLQAMNKTNVLLALGEASGRPWTRFRGIEVKTVDAILNTESRLT